ncbi:RNA polymerase Rpc34 subunit, partial [Teladorsagia circumcincta]
MYGSGYSGQGGMLASAPTIKTENAINNLLVSKKLVIAKTSGGTLRLKVNTNTQLSGATEEEQAIFTLIEDSKRKGIWIRELRDGSGLSQIQLRKVLKSLEQKKLIKNIKSRRKQAIDSHPDDISMQKELSCVRSQEVADFIMEKRVLNVSITVEDVERILEVAILDGAIERRPDGK